ncbi:MAG: hypothetical protein PHD15_05025 [Clostridia bacterium]|nr:hypothetical protein [Clostridia bacterium]MDD4387096.1 hypothetical protein [Clostridia bacterium]
MSSKVKYSKNKLIMRRLIPGAVIIFILLLIAYITFITYINVTNNIVYENINSDSSIVDDNIAYQSTPIVINNIILGGVYNYKWVSMERYYFESINKKLLDIDVYTKKGKTGTYKLSEVSKEDEATAAYTSTTRTNYTDEYLAVKTGNTTISKMNEVILNESNTIVYKNKVKKALGLYGILNNTVKIREVYEVALVPGKLSYIITATNDGKNNRGVYSVAIYASSMGDIKLIKYNYVKDVNNSSNFGIYTTKFVADLNGDNVCDIILQETNEFNSKYSVMELSNGKFYEVLSATINN